MPVFTSKDKLKSGVPLGGIGAGKLELLPNGLFNGFSFQNNWSEPISGNGSYPGILGFHMGVSTDTPAVKKAFLLQTVPVAGLTTIKHIRYNGIFPCVRLQYDEPRLGFELSLEAFSPWIPGETSASSLPASFFQLKVRNPRAFPVRFGFIFIGLNTSGSWCVGRHNRIDDEKNTVSLEFSNSDRAGHDSRQGTLRFSFVKQGWQTSFMESWNAVTKNFSFNAENISLAGWDDFKEGALPDTKPGFTACGENQELCGAVAAHRTLPARGEAVLTFMASWYFPNHPFGHRYTRWFKNAKAVAAHAVPRVRNIKRKVDAVQRGVFSLPYPRWFNEALLTNLSPFFSSSWFVGDGRFAFYEAPVVCPLMGTIDVGFYGSIPLGYFFPELELSQMRLFAASQREDGYIPHDLGKNRIDLPSNGTTFYQWKDLNPKFVLMTYRDALWSKDRRFLKELYPHVKKAINWSLKTDVDGNGLPDNEGADQTFDLWYFYGTNAYTSGIFLAALLAAEKMALLCGDRAFAAACRGHFVKGRASFERELWNGRFFGETCSLSQLNGQWYADLLGLGLIADKAKIRKALHSILTANTRHSRYGMVNSVTPSGGLDVSNNHSKNIWCGMNYAFASLCITQGFPVNNLLKEIHKLWDNIVRIQKNPWNQPDMIDSKTGQFLFGDSYYRNMAIWSIPIAHSLKNRKIAAVLRALKQSGRNTQ